MNRVGDRQRLYLAGMGMITPLGGNTAMTAAAVASGISAYQVTDYLDSRGHPITMGLIPVSALDELELTVDAGLDFNAQRDYEAFLAAIAVSEACSQLTSQHPVLRFLALPERLGEYGSFVADLNSMLPRHLAMSEIKSIFNGRAGCIEAIDAAFRAMPSMNCDTVLVGGVESYRDDEYLESLGKASRLLTSHSRDGFAPGEAAGFLLLTRQIESALKRKDCVIALSPPGIADEHGHIYSDEPYRGEGLDEAFKKALVGYGGRRVEKIYSSMNGERYWAKEYGVACSRNREAFVNPILTEHPADCYGDLGAAAGAIQVALAAEDLFQSATARCHLVYCSSDRERRGAVVVEKIAVD